MNRLNVEAAAITHIGSIKSNNEDNYYVNGSYKSDSSIDTHGIADKKMRNSHTYAVCDGMGGESYGELASLIAVATLAKYEKTDIRQTFNNYVNTANEFIYDLIKKNREKKIGTTLALLNINTREGKAVSYNIGNSRVYFCRRGSLYLVSRDFDKNDTKALTQYLGVLASEGSLKPYASEEIKLKKGDVFMLCTCGLTDVLSNNEIVEFLSAENDAATVMAKKLAAAAQEEHAKDDLTVIVVKVTGN